MKHFDKIDVKEIVEKPLVQIWNEGKTIDLHQDIINRKFLAPRYLFADSLLFLGINPSYSGGLEFNNIANYYEVRADNIDLLYFKKFDEISKHVNCNWTHLDLLFFRETEQAKIDSIMNNNGVKFIYDQLCVSKQLIEKCNPKLIIASNTKVRQFLGFDKDENGNNTWMDFVFTFNEDLGTHVLSNDKMTNVPIFFTSMLSGQRALDRGSFERLKWHIKYVINKIQ